MGWDEVDVEQDRRLLISKLEARFKHLHEAFLSVDVDRSGFLDKYALSVYRALLLLPTLYIVTEV